MKNPFIILLLSVIILTNCNENFWGYNYDAPALINITHIHGNLVDKYSGEPIHPATITVNGQETKTDENGNYLMNYIIPEEIEPNQQEIGYVSIVAPDYLHYNSSFIILPVDNVINIELEYSVPTILNAVSHGDTTQAIIRDYQGIDDIRYTTVTFLEDTGYGVWIRKEFELNEMINIDMYTSYYEFVVDDSVNIMNLSRISDWFRITAKDKSDNIHRLDFTINPDSSLFF